MVTDWIKNFLTPEVFFNNVLVIITIRLVLLMAVLQIVTLFIRFLSKKFTAKAKDREQAKQIHTILVAIKSFVNIVISLLFGMEILNRLGVDIRPILTAAGVLGVAVGFGAKRFVEDIITGIMLIWEGQIRVGDYIEIGSRTGTVEKLNLKMVMLRDTDGKVHYIRNGMIDVVTNYTRDYAFALIELGVAYKENVDYVMNVIKDIAQNELKQGELGQYILGDIEMFGVNSFGDSSVNIKFRLKTLPTQQWAVAREFNRLIKNKFDELGIEIPFPQVSVHVERES